MVKRRCILIDMVFPVSYETVRKKSVNYLTSIISTRFPDSKARVIIFIYFPIAMFNHEVINMGSEAVYRIYSTT